MNSYPSLDVFGTKMRELQAARTYNSIASNALYSVLRRYDTYSLASLFWSNA